MFGRLLRRLRTDESRERDATITDWVRELPGVTLIAEAKDRDVVKVGGIVSRLRVRPRDGVAAYEATINDGTGEVRAIWLGRRTMPGLMLGVRLVAEGRLGRDQKGRLQILNPSYGFEPTADVH